MRHSHYFQAASRSKDNYRSKNGVSPPSRQCPEGAQLFDFPEGGDRFSEGRESAAEGEESAVETRGFGLKKTATTEIGIPKDEDSPG